MESEPNSTGSAPQAASSRQARGRLAQKLVGLLVRLAQKLVGLLVRLAQKLVGLLVRLAQKLVGLLVRLAQKLVGQSVQQAQRIKIPLFLSLLAIVVALAVGALLIWASGKNPQEAYLALLEGSLFGFESFGKTLEKATPLVLSGLAVAFAFKAGLFNIGGQGQLIIGATVAAAVGYGVTWLPAAIHIPMALAVGALAGAAYAGIVGLLKVSTGAHEVITTIMLNFVAVNLTDWLVSQDGPWNDGNHLFPSTPEIESTAAIGSISKLPLGFAIAVGVALAVWFALYKTSAGFSLRAVGHNRNAASAAGISVARIVVVAMFISGLLAALGGAIETLGVVGRYQPGFNANLGFDGITIALLARTHPIGVVPAALLIGAMNAGANEMQFHSDVSPEIIAIISALILFFVAAPIIIRFLLGRRAETEHSLEFGSTWGS